MKGKTPRETWIRTGIMAASMLVVSIGGVYWVTTSQRVYVDSASVQASLIALAPSVPGILQEVYVHEGDTVAENTPVARVGNELVKSKIAGIIVAVPQTIGAQVSPNQAVVTMIDPTQLRVVASVDENKGLDRIKIGDSVTFTVDAFGSKQYSAVVDEIAPTSQQSQIVFNISDQREVKQFDVKARFDTGLYSELKNGMSARMWIYTR